MNRRTFFGRFAKAIAGCILAAHVDFGSLIPVPETKLNPIIAGQLEYFVQPLYDLYAIAANAPRMSTALFNVSAAEAG